MKQSTTEPLNGFIEVTGFGQGKNLILGESYVHFPEATATNFGKSKYSPRSSSLQVH
jgi:hypothetical protein